MAKSNIFKRKIRESRFLTISKIIDFFLKNEICIFEKRPETPLYMGPGTYSNFTEYAYPMLLPRALCFFF